MFENIDQLKHKQILRELASGVYTVIEGNSELEFQEKIYLDEAKKYFMSSKMIREG